MKIICSAAAVLLIAGCGPQDPNKVLVDQEVEVPAQKVVYQKFTLDLGGSFTMTLKPKGGNLEAWVEAGDIPPMVIYSESAAYPKAKVFTDGKEDTFTGTLGWGGANAIPFNRSPSPRRVKVKR